MLYYFENVYDASATGEGVFIMSGSSGYRIGGPGFEDHQRRLHIWENGKIASRIGIGVGIVLLIVGSIRNASYGGSEDKKSEET